MDNDKLPVPSLGRMPTASFKIKERQEEELKELDQEVCTWIGDLIGEEKLDQSTQEWLMDGTVLCRLANVIKPDSIDRMVTHFGATEAMQNSRKRENISRFTKVMNSLGEDELCFDTNDLYEGKNMARVVRCLYTLGYKLPDLCPDFEGKHIARTREKTRLGVSVFPSTRPDEPIKHVEASTGETTDALARETESRIRAEQRAAELESQLKQSEARSANSNEPGDSAAKDALAQESVARERAEQRAAELESRLKEMEGKSASDGPLAKESDDRLEEAMKSLKRESEARVRAEQKTVELESQLKEVESQRLALDVPESQGIVPLKEAQEAVGQESEARAQAKQTAPDLEVELEPTQDQEEGAPRGAYVEECSTTAGTPESKVRQTAERKAMEVEVQLKVVDAQKTTVPREDLQDLKRRLDEWDAWYSQNSTGLNAPPPPGNAISPSASTKRDACCVCFGYVCCERQ